MGVMTITDFRLHAGDAVERVEAGEIIEITKNNRTIAELRPKRGVHDAEWNEASKSMIELMRSGLHLGGGPFTEEDKYGDARL